MHLLRRRWFALLFVGEAVNSIGSWTALIALWGYAAYKFDAGPSQIAVLGLAWAVPAVLIGPFVGLPIDRLGPRRVLLVADLAGAAVGLSFLLAQTWTHLVLLGILSGLVKAVTYPASDALPPRLVDDDDLLAANAILGAATDSAIMFGPLLAAAAIAVAGLKAAFVVDAASFLVGAAAIAPLRLRPLATAAAGAERPSPAAELRDGLRLAARSTTLRRTLLLCFAVYLTWGTYVVVEPIYVRDVLNASPTFFAGLQAAFGIGLVLTGLVLPRLGRWAGGPRALGWSVLLSGVTAAVYVGTPLRVVAVVGVMLWGVDVGFFAAPSRTVLQRNSPPEAHGRILALNRTLHSLGDLVALGTAGLVTRYIPVQHLAFGVAALAFAAGAWGLHAAGGAAGTDTQLPLGATDDGPATAVVHP